MSDLSVSYMGLDLRNPIVVASSSMTQSVSGVKKCAEHGAGAVVLKSLFEEQILAEIGAMEPEADIVVHPESWDYIEQMGMRIGPADYLHLIQDAKKEVDVPIIASVNCVSAKWWIHYARQIQDAGADGIELNISIMPRGFSESSHSVEEQFLQIVRAVRKEVTIPIAVKIGPYFSSLPHLADDMVAAGASALVLFNRFYQLDIDVNKMKLSSGYQFSSPPEIHLPIRWISILAGNVRADLAGATGVHDGDGAVKLVLAGATAVQVCSSLFLHGFGHIGTIRDQMEKWMKANGMNTVEQFRGRLSQKTSRNPEQYERTQYIKALTGVS